MTRPIVMDVIARDNASKTFKQVAQSQQGLAKQTEGLAKNNDNLRKSQLQLIAAQERYNKVAKDSGASVGKLASAQSGLITAQQRVTKATRDAGKASEDAAEKHSAIAGKLKFAAAAAGALVAVKLTGFLKDAVGAASDLNETQSKANQIFGENTKAINDWASTAATKLGLSRQAALDAAAGFGDMFKQLGFSGDAAATMSKQTVQLATDLGSFNNLPTATVIDMISGAFRGEYDSLQRVIPNISAARVQQEALNETHKKSASALTAAEKATATLTIIQKDGSRAQGDFARTSGGMANQTKIATARLDDLKAKIGADLLPVVNKLLGFASGLLDVFTRYSDVLVPLVGVLGGVAAAVWAVSKATAAWAVAQQVLNSALVARFAPGLVGMLPPLALAAAAFYGLYKVAGLLTNAISGSDEAMVKAAGRGAKDLAKALQDSGGAFDKTAQKTLATTLVTGGYVDKAAKAHITVEQLTAGVTGNDEAMQSLVDTWRASGKPSEVTIGTLRRLHEQFQNNTASGKQTADTTNKVADAMRHVTGAVPLTALQQQDVWLKANNLTLDDAKKKYHDAVAEATSFTAQLGYMSSALDQLSNNAISATLQQDQLNLTMGTAADKFAGARAQVAAHGTALKGNTANAISNRDWALQQIQAINQQGVTFATSTGKVSEGTRVIGVNTKALKESMRQAGFTNSEIDALIKQYAATPEQITTLVKQKGQEAIVGKLGEMLDMLERIADPAGWQAKVNLKFEQLNTSMPLRARGGLIGGRGGPTEDNHVIGVSTGEFVVNAAATKQNLPLLASINNNGMQKLATGGLVGRRGIGNLNGIIGNRNGITGNLSAAQLQALAMLNLYGAATIPSGQQLAGAVNTIAQNYAQKHASDFAPAGVPAPGNISALQAYAFSLFGHYGWGRGALGSLIALWNGESGWNPAAYNASSGATGIPQALPASKMASAGADYLTNGATQIRWGLGYIRDRYGSPTNAYSFWLSQSPHWYRKGAWDIASDQLAGLHKGEMVLPADIAELVRSGAGKGLSPRAIAAAVADALSGAEFRFDGDGLARLVTKRQTAYTVRGGRR